MVLNLKHEFLRAVGSWWDRYTLKSFACVIKYLAEMKHQKYQKDLPKNEQLVVLNLTDFSTYKHILSEKDRLSQVWNENPLPNTVECRPFLCEKVSEPKIF